MRTARLTLATAGIPFVVLAVAYVLRTAWAGRLPDTIVSHWGTGGPDRGTALTSMTAWTLGLGAAAAVVATVTALVMRHRGAFVPRTAIGFAAWLATLPAGVLIASMWATLDVASWQQARSAWGAVTLAIGLSVAAGALATLLTGPTPRAAIPEPRDLPSAGLAPGERAVWIGAGTNYPMAFAGIGVIGLFLVLQLSLDDLDVMPHALILIVAVLALAATCRVRARVDATGVTLTLGLFRFPHRTLTFDEIASAHVEQMSVWSAGGYGLRRGFGYTAFKVRAGEALAVTLTSGHVVKATVDDAERAAGLVNDLVAAERP
ncbi:MULTISPECIES: DUF1648 domain-containing protein [Prauserella salsuginis group]|uniref:DUF1648 domain-containing protein n=1 Tax=Prauserella salsuginis TaxID=387889 RepID=A0ABW6G2D1_9PSEU|nr:MULTISPECIES: DUF1648 domain-containing protein [Prauserella salsuginis group]MCR3719882.1 hypothetical protein [Prauserella flava]MCR3736575.1 hypothetical protein [Prauserella salsuginis]